MFVLFCALRYDRFLFEYYYFLPLLSAAKSVCRTDKSTGFMKHELHFYPKLVRTSYESKARDTKCHESSHDYSSS